MIRSQLRQLARQGDRAWVGMNMPVRHFSASYAAASEDQSPPSGMRYTPSNTHPGTTVALMAQWHDQCGAVSFKLC